MNIFNKVTLQSMKKNRTRTFVTIIGVVLSATLITAVATFAVTLQNYLVNSAIVKYGDWHVAFYDTNSSFVQEQENDDEVSNIAAFENIGYAELEGGQNPNKPYLFIAGFNEEAFASLPIKLLSGRLPQDSSEILIPAHVAANGGVKYAVGDTFSLAVGNRMCKGEDLNQHTPYNAEGEQGNGAETFVPVAERVYTVVGICERPAFEEHSAPGYTVITMADTDEQTDRFSVFSTLKNPYRIYSYTKNTAGLYSYMFNDDVLQFMGLSDNKMFNTFLYTVGFILIILIMIGSVFLIYNSFYISLNERTRQFGILSSVGATAKQLRNSVLFEGFCIGAVGVPIGVIAGIGSVRLVIPLIAGNFKNIISSDVPLTLTVSLPALVGAAIISMVTILMSADIPARKAARRPVMESIRQTNEIKIGSEPLQISSFAQHIYGLEGMLALKNFKRNKKRYRSIVLSLTLSVVLFVSANAFGSHLKQAAEQFAVDTDYDICFITQDMDESEMFRLYDELRTAGDIYDSSYQAISTYSCKVMISDFSERYREHAGMTSSDETTDLPMDIQFIEDSVYLGFIEGLGLPVEEYTGQNAKMIAVAKTKMDGEKGKSSLYDIFAKPSMNLVISPEDTGDNDELLMGKSKEISITFADTIPIDLIPRQSSEAKTSVFMVVAPYQLKDYFVNSDGCAELGLSFRSENPAESVAEMEAIIQAMGITSEYTLYNIHEIFEQSRNIVFVIDVFTYIFTVMISLIAIANVFNTISTNIMLRRRELAMLRSVGMNDRDFNKMMNFECIFFGTRTLVFGIPIAGILSWLIYKGVVIAGADVSFLFPWVSIIVSVVGVLLVVFITMLYAIRKIKSENIIDALRDVMT